MDKILKSSIPYKNPSSENLIEFLKIGLRKYPDASIIVDSTTGVSWTGKEIEVAIGRIAKYLIENCGLKKGDVCSLYGEESAVFSILILAIASVGGASHFLSERSSGWDVENTATVLKSKFLFSCKSLLKKIKTNLADLMIDEKFTIVSCDELCGGLWSERPPIKHLFSKDISQQGFSLEELIVRVPIIPETDYAVIQFSSGTTGKPKPIPRTHKNVCHLVASVDHEELVNLKPGVIMSGALPITHRPGLWALLASINCGSTFVIWSNLSNVEEALAVIEKYKVSIFSSSLPLLSMLGSTGIQIKDKYDTSSLKHILTSGAKILNENLPLSLIEEFNLESVRQCFGMTESGWVFLIEQSLAEGKFLSVGHVVPGMEAVILDRETNQRLAAYERGEIALRGPQIFPGYLATQPGVLNRSDFTEDGWFKIGDQGYYDKSGLFFIEGRYKEKMLFENDCKYFPSEIESVITEHPAVEAACVVRIAPECKDYQYDIARAYTTIKQGYNVTEKEIINFVQERAPEVILGGGVRVIDRFPRLQNGKIDKQTLAKID